MRILFAAAITFFTAGGASAGGIARPAMVTGNQVHGDGLEVDAQLRRARIDPSALLTLPVGD